MTSIQGGTRKTRTNRVKASGKHGNAGACTRRCNPWGRATEVWNPACCHRYMQCICYMNLQGEVNSRV